MARQLKCPVCQKSVPPREENPAFPFCSPRCRSVDLGKWLGEEYRVPEREGAEREDELPSVDSDSDSGGESEGGKA